MPFSWNGLEVLPMLPLALHSRSFYPPPQPQGLKWKLNYSSQNSLIGHTKLPFPAPLARGGDWARPSVDRLGDYNSRDAS